MVKNTLLPSTFSINCKGRLLDISSPVVMGVINVTEDSFYAGSRYPEAQSILQTVEQMLSEGAGIIDIGGQSTRPRATLHTAAEEAGKVVPVIEKILGQFPGTIISIDTFYAEVARAAVAAGAAIVNDISAGNMDAEMNAAVGALQTPYIAMHMQGTPATMQDYPTYTDVVKEVLDFFIAKTEECRLAGIKDIIIDPGFGFGKNLTHNYTLLKHLSVLRMPGKLLMAGVSRKSMIYRLLGVTAAEALNGTTALHILALQNGADILRVHDVKPAMEAVKLWKFYESQPDVK